MTGTAGQSGAYCIRRPVAFSGKLPVVRLVRLPAVVIHALAAGDLVAANRAAPISLGPYFVDAEEVSVWRRRSLQIEADPASAAWITRAIWDPDLRVAVGRAGFHGPPDSAGMVEIGYAVDPVHRRRGYARAAVESLLDRAFRAPGAHTVRASIRPANYPSTRLVTQYGFIPVGEQWDDEDGWETIYELSASAVGAG